MNQVLSKPVQVSNLKSLTKKMGFEETLKRSVEIIMKNISCIADDNNIMQSKHQPSGSLQAIQV
jgi:hypothetical protein